MTHVPTQRGNLDAETHIKRTPHEDESRDRQINVQQAKEHQGRPVDQEKLEGKRGTNASLQLRRNQPCLHLDLGLEAPRTVRQYIPTV